MQQRRWVAEARAAADHARQQSRAAAAALAPVYDLDPDDIAWGEHFGTPLRLGHIRVKIRQYMDFLPSAAGNSHITKKLSSACSGCDTCRRFSPDMRLAQCKAVCLPYTGMAQVASRAFGGFQDPGLAPFIDLMNHANEAQHPLG